MARIKTTQNLRLTNGTVVKKGGQMRKVRSPTNHQLAFPTVLPDGTPVLRTANGMMFKVTPMK
jgi:hypothetical protein